MKQQPKLPQYFVIKRDETNPLWKKYIDWLNEKYGYNVQTGTFYKYYGFDGNGLLNGLNGDDNICDFENNPELTTLEYWNECVNGKTTEQTRLIYNPPETMEQRKIIGYKAPCDLFKGHIKKGDIYVAIGYAEYCPQRGLELNYNLPKEIVETWEPCYEEEKLEIVEWNSNYIFFDKDLTQEIIDKIKKVIV